MSDATEIVLARLRRLEFTTRTGALKPFDEPLPLVTGAAWHVQTAQLALIAEFDANDDIGTWRQLLFAGSGIRHHLVGDGPAAFGTPLTLAIVDAEGERRLRELSEDPCAAMSYSTASTSTSSGANTSKTKLAWTSTSPHSFRPAGRCSDRRSPGPRCRRSGIG